MNKTFNGAVLALQGEIGTLQKNALNPHFKSRYLSLDALVEHIQPLLTKHGLIWLCRPASVDGAPVLTYNLIHVESGEGIEGRMPLLLEKQNAQGLGSAITYARRYALCAVLNIVADVDDDGSKASAKMPATPPKDFAASEKPQSFTDQVRATGKKAAEIREWAGSEGYTLDDVGVDAKGLTAFLNGLSEMKQAKLLKWADAS